MARPQGALPPIPRQPSPGSEESLPPSDGELIAASHAGNANAYATLYLRHAGAARILARQLVHGRSEADDVVSEAFARVLALIKRGGGPAAAFRPYLLTTVRRVAYDRFRAEGRLVVSGEMEAFDPGVPFTDPALAGLERTMIARAFASLPERWRAVLWHTEIEGARPAEVAALLGLTANGVAALAYRAREGLRQAYLQMHLSGVARSECRPLAGKLGAYVRDGLAKRETAAVAAHLDQCADCRAVYAELADVNVALRGIAAPIILGPAAAAYLGAISHHGGSAVAWIAGRLAWFRHAPKSQQAATAAAAAAAAGIVALALAASTTPIPHSAPPPAPVPAVPAPAPPVQKRPVPAPPAPKPASRPAYALLPEAAPPRPAPRATQPQTTQPQTTQPQTTQPQTTQPQVTQPQATPSPVQPQATPSPVRTSPVQTPPAPVRLAALINPVGALLQGGTGLVQFTVANTGRTVSQQVTAAITLPSGVNYQDPPMAGGWTCATASAGASCDHGPLSPGAVATGYLPVTVASNAPVGAAPAITVPGSGQGAGQRPGGSSSTERGSVGVTAGGLGARFAATGQDTVVSAGAPMCRWWNSSSGSDGSDGSDSALTLPGQVLWAGLYWSWSTWWRSAPDGARELINLRGPGGDYQQVSAADVGSAAFPDGRLQFEAFADVTSLVAEYGSGLWSVAPAGWGTGNSGWAGAGNSGWTLVVVTADPQAALGTQVMVLDGARAVGPSLAVPLDALPPGPDATVHTVTWTQSGPRTAAFEQNLAISPAVSFTTAYVPYLVGVVTVTDPP